MSSHGAVPLTSYSASQQAFGVAVRIDAFAEHAGQFEDALAVLAGLVRRWGPDGELAALAAAPVGLATTCSWDTLLLLAMSEAAGVELDLEHQTARRLEPLTPPDVRTQHAIAARLVAQELDEAGCVAVRVVVGEAVEGPGRLRPRPSCRRRCRAPAR